MEGGVKYMSRRLYFNRTGYCPTQDDYETIEVESVELLMAGNPTPGYKKMSFDCHIASENNCSIANNCPIYREAPHNPYLA